MDLNLTEAELDAWLNKLDIPFGSKTSLKQEMTTKRSWELLEKYFQFPHTSFYSNQEGTFWPVATALINLVREKSPETYAESLRGYIQYCCKKRLQPNMKIISI